MSLPPFDPRSISPRHREALLRRLALAIALEPRPGSWRARLEPGVLGSPRLLLGRRRAANEPR